MKSNKLKSTRAQYVCPSVRTTPLSLDSVICGSGSNGELESTNIVNPYDVDDLG